MPPKKAAAAGPSKKNVEKAKKVNIEDKTFGLKNKKGTKQQKYIEQVNKQVSMGSKADIESQKKRDDLKKKKADEKAELEELNLLLGPVIPGGKLEPALMICSFFKQGMCGKGAKCKFSHDLSKEVEPQKKNLYFDEREKSEDTMENWDEATLAEVANKKHGVKDANKTTITCKFFLDAVEAFKYGWFWNCPTGDSCKYRHALPQGYILKRDKKKLDEQAKMEDKITIEELIEQERQKLGGNLTPVNPTTILAWKKRKIAEARKTAIKVETKKMKAFKQGKSSGLTGKEMFTYNPSLATADDDGEHDADGEVDMRRVVEEHDETLGKVHEIDDSLFLHEMGVDEEAGASAINESLFDDVDLPSDDEDDDDDEVTATNANGHNSHQHDDAMQRLKVDS